jgi:hypothetical protein
LLGTIAPVLLNALFGVIVGGVTLGVLMGIKKAYCLVGG